MMTDRLDHLGFASRLTASPLAAWGLLPAPLTPDTCESRS